MSGYISKQTKPGSDRAYYYYRDSYRVKLDSKDEGKKGPGSGKSKVITDNIYLGTAENILDKFLNPAKPRAIREREFGLIGALYNVANELQLIPIINEICPGSIKGISIGEYIFIAAANRVGNHDSKVKIGKWFKGTKLPQLMNIEPNKLNSDAFWQAYDIIISQEAISKKMHNVNGSTKKKMTFEEAADYLTEQKVVQIEEKIYLNMIDLYNLTTDTAIYDTTNFHSNISSLNDRCCIPQTGKSKDGKDNKRLTGLLLAVEKSFGIPLFHSIYQGSRHDSSIFPSALEKTTIRMAKIMKNTNGFVFVFDKGNNSKKNIETIRENELIKSFVGSLSFSMCKDLMEVPLDYYTGTYKKWDFMETQKEVFGETAKIVITYSQKEYERESECFERRLKTVKERIEKSVIEKCKKAENKGKQIGKVVLKKAIDKTLAETKVKSSYAKKYIGYSLRKTKTGFKVIFRYKEDFEKRKQAFGKRILFSYDLERTEKKMIKLYHSKYKVEDAFRNFKGGDIVNYNPIYHWTDSKIRVQAFVNVLAYLLIKIVEMKIRKAGEYLSLQTIKETLEEIKEVVMIHSIESVVTEFLYPSKIHKKLAKILEIDKLDSS